MGVLWTWLTQLPPERGEGERRLRSPRPQWNVVAAGSSLWCSSSARVCSSCELAIVQAEPVTMIMVMDTALGVPGDRAPCRVLHVCSQQSWDCGCHPMSEQEIEAALA